MMGTEEVEAVGARKTTLTPKAIIHQKFGDKASYKIEEVHESTPTGCPGLTIPQKGPCLYRCSLQLPEISVVSGTFKKKKDAEQCAAEMALEKLGLHLTVTDSTPQDPWEILVSRIRYLFSDEFPSFLHPLSGHFRATFGSKGDACGLVPVSVIAVYDAKLHSLCKSIDSEVELNPLLIILFIMRATSRLSEFLVTSKEHLWIRRQNPYPPEIIESSRSELCGSPKSVQIEAIFLPCSLEKSVGAMTLHVSSNEYFLDVIAKKLGLEDAHDVLVSRNVGKASSETRVFFAAPKSYLLHPSDLLNAKEALHFDEPLNVRASYLSGQDIFGDAILASIAYTWKSKDLFHEDVTIQSYYRMLMTKIPSGIYKLSREAILAAELPSAFTTRTNWRGSFPREILCMFCRQHRLSEPVFSTLSTPLKALPESSGSCKKLKVSDSVAEETECVNHGNVTASSKQLEDLGGSFTCVIKLLSKCQTLLIECSPKDSYKKQADAIQSASLKLILWLNMCFKDLNMTLENLNHYADVNNIQIYSTNFFKEFALCQILHDNQCNSSQGSKLLESICVNTSYSMPGYEVCSLKIEGPDSGVWTCSGSLTCISYSVSLVTKDERMKVLLEGQEEFEFEVGVGALISHIEAIVMQMSVGQSACFNTNIPAPELLLASASDSARTLSLLSSEACYLEYFIILSRVTEPLEDRMEKALFSPPLSKQRVEYAVQHIRESHATSLVDFGCGSGSLLDSLLNYQTSLETIIGVDISQKSLSRAAKVLHSKLGMNLDADVPYRGIKSVVLYDGSITTFDSRLSGFDIGTCLEVIEHMEEDQACLFGDVVLNSFCPRILIVSTPNYEYNVILQGSNPPTQEEELDEKTQLISCKFRNNDHKFEWTREQFNRWATDLASRHNYSVEFSGVGGSADQEPGFASQIAVFRRRATPDTDAFLKNTDTEHHYKVIWEWNRNMAAAS